MLTAIDLSKKTFNRIRLNYVWALGYNCVMIPVAAGVLYPSLRWQLPPYLAGERYAVLRRYLSQPPTAPRWHATNAPQAFSGILIAPTR